MRYHSTMIRPYRFACGLMAALFAISSLAGNPLPELGDAASEELTLATEKRIGQQIMHEIRSREPSYLDDPEIESYLNQLGGRLAGASTDPAIGFYFFALEDSSINAFATVSYTHLDVYKRQEKCPGRLLHQVAHRRSDAILCFGAR